MFIRTDRGSLASLHYLITSLSLPLEMYQTITHAMQALNAFGCRQTG